MGQLPKVLRNCVVQVLDSYHPISLGIPLSTAEHSRHQDQHDKCFLKLLDFVEVLDNLDKKRRGVFA
ncbi:MAG: hypothetical protein DMF69_22690 [Acidobacteria bacterium]|nr:MAG: hypothetical protein DMF69_22690 [Acidobacteriota bacterium]